MLPRRGPMPCSRSAKRRRVAAAATAVLGAEEAAVLHEAVLELFYGAQDLAATDAQAAAKQACHMN